MKYLFLGSIIAAIAAGLALPAGSAVRHGGKPAPGSMTVGGTLFQSVVPDRYSYASSDPITFVYCVTNSSDSPVTFQFRSGKHYDIWVTFQGAEVFRLSRGKMYTQALGALVLRAGETKQFTAVWEPKKSGLILQKGSYVVHAQLQPSSAPPPEVTSTFNIGARDDTVVPLTVSEAIKRSLELAGKNVSIDAVYMGWKGDSTDANLKDGPPLTRSDWIIADSSGSMYVSGSTSLDHDRSVGARVNVVGRLARTATGQVYVVAGRVTMLK